VGRVLSAVCLSGFSHDISKTDPARITKLDIQMFHDESWKLIYFAVKRSKVKVTTPALVFSKNTNAGIYETKGRGGELSLSSEGRPALY